MTVAGVFFQRSGRSLRSLDSIELFEAAYALYEERAVVDKELREGRDSFEKHFRDIVREEETGIPSAVANFPGADASQFGGGDT